MIRLEIKNYNTILLENDNTRQYYYYRQVKLININILWVKKYCFLIKVE